MTSYDEAAVGALRHEPIPPQEKGFGGPLHVRPVTAAELVEAAPLATGGWLGSPRAVVRQSALNHNIATMARYCDERGIVLFPHGKTSMAPQVVAAQLAAGAGGVTVATATQARILHRFGFTRLLIANQVTDEAGATWLGRLLSEDPSADVTCYVDSPDGVELLDDAVTRQRPAGRLPVLVELGHAAGRTGARTLVEARSVAEAVGQSRGLRLAGVAGYEGSLARLTPEETVVAASDFCGRLAELATDLLAGGHLTERPVVSAGGSAYFDAVVDVLAGQDAWQLVLRSGCYVTHDHGLYGLISPFERSPGTATLRPALEVWAPVLSRPEPGTVVVGVGRRDVSSDAGLPVVRRATRVGVDVGVDGATAQRLYDQHLVVGVPPGSGLRPGDEVELGISHPCTTFDKWRWLPLVDDEHRVVDVLRTFF